MSELLTPRHDADDATGDDADPRALEVQASVPDVVHVPGDPGYDQSRMAWNLAAEQRPAAVAVPETVTQLSQVVRAASRAGLRVAPQNTGHAAGTLAAHALDDVVLVRLTALRGVFVDPARRTARVDGGAVWEDLLQAAIPHGLTALHGSAPDVGIVGYTLGGGLSFYSRKHGLAANSVTAVEVVGADGEVVRADALVNSDLFWAVRGGGGNFGIVTALEFALYPITEVYGGMLLWDLERAGEVVTAWADWCTTAPDEIATSLRVMRFPPLPELPDFLRGRSVVIIDGVALLDDDAALAQLAPLRALEPEMDTFGRIPAAAVTQIHMDPPQPVPAVGAGTMIDRLDPDAVAAFLTAVGPGVETPVFIAELRQLGGAVGVPVADGGALAHLPGSHAGMFVAMAPTPEAAVAGSAATGALVEAMAPWANGRNFPNFSERPIDTSSAYDASSWSRLRQIRAEVDPASVFLANHAIDAHA